MSKYIRYALATFCFAASVGCLALWIFSATRSETWDGAHFPLSAITLDVSCTEGTVALQLENPGATRRIQTFISHRKDETSLTHWKNVVNEQGHFGNVGDMVFFPLWFPALIFILAGVGILRVGRFTLRSANIATTVVAGLLGVAVGM